MPDQSTTPADGYLLRVDQFAVTVGPDRLTFTEVSGLEVRYGTIAYRHGLSYREGEGIVKFRANAYAPVTFKGGSARNGQALLDWLKEGSSKPRSMQVDLLDQTGVVCVSWKFGKAVAVRLAAPTLDAHGQGVAIDILEVMAANIEQSLPPIPRIDLQPHIFRRTAGEAGP